MIVMPQHPLRRAISEPHRRQAQPVAQQHIQPRPCGLTLIDQRDRLQSEGRERREAAQQADHQQQAIFLPNEVRPAKEGPKNPD